MPASKRLQSASQMKEMEVATIKGRVPPSKQILRERRSKAVADFGSDVAKAPGKWGGSL